jgi:cholesterol oxidase
MKDAISWPPGEPADTDVVVIGSGFGGSVAANRLALAGRRVMVLERGPWRDSLPVRSMGIERRSPFPYGVRAVTHLLHSFHRGSFDLRLHKAGMFELFSSSGLHVMAASAVGGGSTAYGGLLEPPRHPEFWRGRHPELDPADIERYYDKVIADMGGVRLGPQHSVPQSIWTHLPVDRGRQCQPSQPQPHMALLIPPSTDAAGQEVVWHSGVLRRYCAFDGDSFLGSRGGAKASVDFTYLAPVLGKGVAVHDLCEVSAIRRAPSTAGYVVEFTDLVSRERTSVRAGQVVLAAGTMNTQRLLFASSLCADGLEPMPSLGRRFGANGDYMALWRSPLARESSFRSSPSQGAFAVSGHESATYGLGGLPGVDTLPLPSTLKRWLEKVFLIYGIGPDSGRASVAFRRGRLRVDYDPAGEPVFDEIRSAFHALSSESGGKTWAVRTPLTVHPWGGAVLGPDAGHGVGGHRGQVYRNPGLFIADASALPAAPGGPPALAIAAWAHHVAQAIAPL